MAGKRRARQPVADLALAPQRTRPDADYMQPRDKRPTADACLTPASFLAVPAFPTGQPRPDARCSPAPRRRRLQKKPPSEPLPRSPWYRASRIGGAQAPRYLMHSSLHTSDAISVIAMLSQRATVCVDSNQKVDKLRRYRFVLRSGKRVCRQPQGSYPGSRIPALAISARRCYRDGPLRGRTKDWSPVCLRCRLSVSASPCVSLAQRLRYACGLARCFAGALCRRFDGA